MTVVLIDGFDSYPAATGDGGVTSGGWTLSATTSIVFSAGRFGGRAIGYSGSGGTRELTKLLPAAVTAFALGFAYKPSASVPASNVEFASMRSASGGQCGVGVNTAGQLVAFRGSISTIIGTAGVTPDWTAWQGIEVEGTIHDTTGELRVYLNGALVIDLSGVDTQGQTETDADRARFTLQGSNNFGSGGVDPILDDCYVADVATRLGDCRVITVRPDADGATTDFTPLGGGTNFAEVDETTCDGDTSYNEADAAGAIDYYGLAALGLTPGSIHAVQVSMAVKKTDAGTREARTKLLSNATTVNGDTLALTSSYAWIRDIVELDPNTAAAWTVAGLDAAFAGVEIIT